VEDENFKGGRRERVGRNATHARKFQGQGRDQRSHKRGDPEMRVHSMAGGWKKAASNGNGYG